MQNMFCLQASCATYQATATPMCWRPSSHSSGYAPGAVQAQLNLPRKRVAVAVLASDNSSPEWHDAFAILALSVKKAFATSKFELDLLALTSKAISNKEDTALKNLGFIVRPLPLPIRADSIQNTFTREEVKKGCCGRLRCSSSTDSHSQNITELS